MVGEGASDVYSLESEAMECDNISTEQNSTEMHSIIGIIPKGSISNIVIDPRDRNSNAATGQYQK